MKQETPIFLTPGFSISPVLLTVIYLAEAVLAFLLIKDFIKWHTAIKNLRLKIKKQEADLEMMTAGAAVNPHFIQNLFEFACGTIKNKTTEKSLAVINELGNYLKKFLAGGQKNQVSILEELVNTRQYMDMQLRINPDSFSYAFYTTPVVNIRSMKIPSMILQPVIENCIKHGFSGIRYKGFIAITILVKEDMVTIRIKDNGRGLTNEWSKDKIAVMNSKSSGIETTRKRLQLAQGPALAKKVSVVLENNTGNHSGTTLTMHFPVNV